MKLMHVSLLCLSLGAFSSAGAVGYSSLEERMSQADMHATGVDKLSPAELKALNDWLQAHSTGTLTHAHAAEAFYPEAEDKVAVKDAINGKFTGWRGTTTFTLKNGQQWQQAESGAGCTGYAETDPKVTIKPMLLGSWLLTLDNSDCSVRVKRIK